MEILNSLPEADAFGKEPCFRSTECITNDVIDTFNVSFENGDYRKCFNLLLEIYSAMLNGNEIVKDFNNSAFLEKILKLYYVADEIDSLTLLLNIGRIMYKYDVLSRDYFNQRKYFNVLICELKESNDIDRMNIALYTLAGIYDFVHDKIDWNIVNEIFYSCMSKHVDGKYVIKLLYKIILMEFSRLDVELLISVIMSVLRGSLSCSVVSKILRCLIICINKRNDIAGYLESCKVFSAVFSCIHSTGFLEYRENAFIFLCFFAVLSRNIISDELYDLFFSYQDFFINSFMSESENKTVMLDVFFSFLSYYPSDFYNYLSSYVVNDSSLLSHIIRTSTYSDKFKTLKIIHLMLSDHAHSSANIHLYNTLLENGFISTYSSFLYQCSLFIECLQILTNVAAKSNLIDSFRGLLEKENVVQQLRELQDTGDDTLFVTSTSILETLYDT